MMGNGKSGSAFYFWALIAAHVVAIALIQAFISAEADSPLLRFACTVTLVFCTEFIDLAPPDWAAKARIFSLQIFAMQAISVGFFLYALIAPTRVNFIKAAVNVGFGARQLVFTGGKDRGLLGLASGIFAFIGLAGLVHLALARATILNSLSNRVPNRSIYGLDVWITAESAGWTALASASSFLACALLVKLRGRAL